MTPRALTSALNDVATAIWVTLAGSLRPSAQRRMSYFKEHGKSRLDGLHRSILACQARLGDSG